MERERAYEGASDARGIVSRVGVTLQIQAKHMM